MLNKPKLLLSFLCLALFFCMGKAFAQTSTAGGNSISTAVSFLTITPDSRAGAMGDVGVATSPDVNAIYWNPAKLIKSESDFAIALSYTPWLRNLVNDMNLAYLSGYYRLDDNQLIGVALRYFSLGEFSFLQTAEEVTSSYKPNEWALNLAYSRKLSDKLSGAIAFRYIRSDLTKSQNIGTVASNPGNAVAADVSLYYQQKTRKEMLWSWGVNISNIGSKIAYTDGGDKAFIPANLRLGTALEMKLNASNSLTIATDLNKLLVPTPRHETSEGNENKLIVGYSSSEKSVIGGIFSSFTDAPDGFSEELKEITCAFGLEYWYEKRFALRAGYHYEHEDKGNRKYFTGGVGVCVDRFALDFSYLVSPQKNHPLQNTLRFSLSFQLDKIK